MRPWSCQVFGARVHKVSGSIIAVRGSENVSIRDRSDISDSRNRDRSDISDFRNRDRSNTSDFRNG